MALQKRVSQLPAVATVVGTDLLIVSSNNATKRTSVQQIGAYFAANGVAGPQGPVGPAGAPGATNYAQLTNVPATFPPSAHGHTIAEVTGLTAALDGKQATGSYVVTSDSRLSDAREWSASTATQAEAEAGTSTSRLAFTPLRVFQAIAAWWAASAAKTKLDGIATGATANATDAQLRDRSTHTGTQTASTISDFTTAVVAAAPPTTNASLLTSGTISEQRIPNTIARTSDITTAVANVVNAAPAALDTLNELAAALGNDASFATTVTNSLASKAPLASPTFTGTVSGITKSMVGLGNVDNTSDASKPVSTAQAAADAAVASAAASDATSKANAAQAAAVQRANHTGTQAISTVSGLQTALDAKAPLANPTFTGLVDINGDIGATQAYFSSILVNGNHTITNASVNGSSRLVVDGQVVVLGNDARLTDARTPTAHNQAWSTITSTPTTLSGYGITDGVTTSDSRLSDARTPTAHNQAWTTITSTPTTLAGYGITDAAAVSHTHSAADLTSGTVATARLGSGTASASNFLRGDGTWAAAGSTSASDLTSGTLPEARLPNLVILHPFLLAGM